MIKLHILTEHLFMEKSKNDSIIAINFIKPRGIITNAKLQSTLGRALVGSFDDIVL